jgi:hypothetical protein
MDDYLELVSQECSNIMTSLDVVDSLATVKCADGKWRHAGDDSIADLSIEDDGCFE